MEPQEFGSDAEPNWASKSIQRLFLFAQRSR